ncbi:MAG: glycoside hydrolase family 88 protein [Bacteroidaceae bacterium]|nr:glycoside hydrolase family 88 protein [Bacteroidaceae bacterium]
MKSTHRIAQAFFSILLFSLGLQAQTADYSRRMVESHGKAWSADKKWDYVSGLVTKSLLKCTTQYPDEEWSLTAYDWCKFYADAALNEDGTFKAFKKGNIDNIASGKVFFELYHRELAKGKKAGKKNAAKYKAAADYLYNYLRTEYSRIQLPEGKGCFFHKDIYPNQMWLDGLYMGAAFYAEYLATFAPEDMEGWSDIANQFITVHRHTYDPEKKLNYHGWSADPADENSFWANQCGPFVGCSREFWGRGMGWFFAALVDVLEVMPKSHPDYTKLNGILAQVAEGLKQWQDDESGVWYQLLQYDDSFVGKCGIKNYLEASASCMFTYSYLKGVRLGLLDESYRPVAEKAYNGVIKTFVTENEDKTLNLNWSCRSAGLGPKKSPQRDGSASYYLCGSDVTIVSNEGKSLGPFIMASLEWELTKK